MFIFSLNENPRHPARHLSKVGVLHPFPVYVVQKYKKAMGRQKKWREKFLNLEEFINFAIEKQIINIRHYAEKYLNIYK